MHAISLQSGSNGNCIYVEAGDTRLIFDAGISGIQAERRLADFGRDIRNVDALLVSHDHSDHIRSAGIFGRKYSIPLHITEPTLAAAHGRVNLGELREHHFMQAGTRFQLKDVTIETISTPHDAADGIVFVVEHEGKRLGYMTDLGNPFDTLAEVLPTLDALIIESNYDEQMLMDGSYPAFLKKRIAGEHGHISNGEAANLLSTATSPRLQWVALAHLSEENNTPDRALCTHREVLGSTDFALTVASRYEALDLGPVE